MPRYTRIERAAFNNKVLPLPMSLRLARQSQPLPASGDGDAFVTDIQLARPTITAELRLRGTAVAESLWLGQTGILEVTIAPAQSNAAARKITLDGAVLCSIELTYDQTDLACATLKFIVAADSTNDPFQAEDAS